MKYEEKIKEEIKKYLSNNYFNRNEDSYNELLDYCSEEVFQNNPKMRAVEIDILKGDAKKSKKLVEWFEKELSVLEELESWPSPVEVYGMAGLGIY